MRCRPQTAERSPTYPHGSPTPPAVRTKAERLRHHPTIKQRHQAASGSTLRHNLGVRAGTYMASILADKSGWQFAAHLLPHHKYSWLALLVTAADNAYKPPHPLDSGWNPDLSLNAEMKRLPLPSPHPCTHPANDPVLILMPVCPRRARAPAPSTPPRGGTQCKGQLGGNWESRAPHAASM